MADKNKSNDKPSTGRAGKIAAGLGVATAAAFGAAWANARTQETRRNGPPDMVDWQNVRAMVRRMNPEPEVTAAWKKEWTNYYGNLVLRVVPIIEDYTGTKLPRNLTTVSAVSRAEWAEANIASFKQLFDPIEQLNRDAIQRTSLVGQAVMGNINQLLISGEMGLLLGYLARRVLGQYDLSLLGKEPVAAGKVYFVEPNIKNVVTNLNIDGDEFRLWIALHESTHAFEFESHPWVRQHFNSILETYFSYISNDLKGMASSGRGISGIVNRVRESKGQGAWLERIMTQEQRDLFQQLQALMSIVEGYSNHVMNAVGEKLMPNYNQIKERVESRQKNRSIIDQLFVKITGLDLKMEQYRLGEIFVDEVVSKKGIAFGNLMWDRPEYIPTLAEVKQPDLWIARIEKAQAA